MQANSLPSIRCCHEIHKLLQLRTREELIGPIDFKFEGSWVFITRKSVSGNLIALELAKKSNIEDYEIELIPRIFHSSPIKTIFEKCKAVAKKLKYSPNEFNYLIYNELTDFFALNYQKFT